MGFAQMIILDTHIWIWWLNDERSRLGSKLEELIAMSDNIAVSAISCFEVAWLEKHGRILLPCEIGYWFDKALAGSSITLLPVTPIIAQVSVNLTEHHSDPQDRIIMATAISNKAQLISNDVKFKLYHELNGLLISKQ